jgi:hypothetical protein
MAPIMGTRIITLIDAGLNLIGLIGPRARHATKWGLQPRLGLRLGLRLRAEIFGTKHTKP